MTSRGFIIVGICLVAIGLSSYAVFVSNKSQRKIGYVVTQKIFSEFDGTKEIDKKIKLEQDKQQNELDSLSVLIQAMTKYNTDKLGLEQAKITYTQLAEKYTVSNRDVNQQYTAQLWKQINQYTNEYGKANNYLYILGADGNGTVMYADSTEDKTKEVLEYANKKYAGE